ncbi:FimD/PapC N-terminal domain-containing protein, partial [Enterococcus faecium]|uniref:FimD/PapC N-terminal domain-containing protein n=1 Tax=Enterococcus faecium TaxID=1352 RepID=UPI003567A776
MAAPYRKGQVLHSVFAAAEFNTDVLDLIDRSNIDLSQFARSGFILPGTYSMVVQLNT